MSLAFLVADPLSGTLLLLAGDEGGDRGRRRAHGRGPDGVLAAAASGDPPGREPFHGSLSTRHVQASIVGAMLLTTILGPVGLGWVLKRVPA